MDDQENKGALDGITVIDLTRVLGGPYCTQILGDHGADVIKIEPPDGDETRHWGPPFQQGLSAYFTGVNRNKRSLILDLGTPEGIDTLLGLLEGADVLIENFKPGTLEKWGLGFDQKLATSFPRLVHCSVTGFGATGPLGGMPGYDAAVQAACGLISVNGEAGLDPVRIGVPVVDMVTGLNAAVAILLALKERHVSGRGQWLDITLYDCGLSLLHPHSANFLMSGKVPAPGGNAHPNISPYDSYRTGTINLFLAVGNDRQFAKLTSVLGSPQLAADPRFATNPQRVLNREALKHELEDLLRAHDGAALGDDLLRAGVPCGPIRDLAQAFAHPHTAHREMIVERGSYRGVASPIKLSRSRTFLRHLPPARGTAEPGS